MLTLVVMLRFTGWFIKQSETNEDVLKEYIKLILDRMADPEPPVQQAACTAFAMLVHRASLKMEAYILDIMKVSGAFCKLRLIVSNRCCGKLSISIRVRV